MSLKTVSFRFNLSVLIFLIGQMNLVTAQNSGVLIDDHFSNTSKNWKEIRLNDATDGSFKFDNQSLSITNFSKVGAITKRDRFKIYLKRSLFVMID